MAWTGAKMMKESLAAIIISIATDFLTGFLMGSFSHFFLLLPGLMILVPASISMRGNVFASLGSRLGTALHLGSIEKFSIEEKEVSQNIYATIYITTVMALVLGIITKASAIVIGEHAINLYDFMVIAFLSGVVSGAVMLVVTFFITFKSYEHNFDPDNVTSPLITGLGDLFTLPSILLSGYLVLKYHAISVALFFVILFGVSYYLIKDYRRDSRVSIIKQSIPILLVCSLIGMISGSVMQGKIELLSIYPSILMLIPVFLEEGGNMGNIFSSRLSTKLHLGEVEPKLSSIIDLKEELMLIGELFVTVFPLVGALTYAISVATNLRTLSLLKMIFLSTAAGALLTISILLITYVVSVYSYKKGIDPDNVSIPILTSVADAIGVSILILVAMAIM